MKTVYIDRPMEPLIGADEAADYLGFSASTVRKMARKGSLPSYAYPRGKGKFLHRYKVSELKQYLTSIQRKPVGGEDADPQEPLAMRAG
jgi:excisionase family DNA binding protein